MSSYFLLWSTQTTPDPLWSGGGMDLSAKKIKRIKRWSHVGTSLSLRRSYGEKAAQGSSFLETNPSAYNVAHTWMTTCGWKAISSPSGLPPSAMIVEMITCRRNWWIESSMVSLMKPTLPMASTQPTPSIVECFAFILCLHFSIFFLIFFFLGPRAISGSQTPPL